MDRENRNMKSVIANDNLRVKGEEYKIHLQRVRWKSEMEALGFIPAPHNLYQVDVRR